MATIAQLDAQIEQVKSLIKLWTRFYELLMRAFAHTELTDEDDRAFQEIKQEVAQRHETFMKAVSKDQYIAQIILETVKRTISIRDFPQMSDVAIDKTIIEWHNANILLYETLGSLEYEHERLSKMTASEQGAQQANKFLSAILEPLKSPAAKAIYKVLAVLLVISLMYIFRQTINDSFIYQNYIKGWYEPGYNSVADFLKQYNIRLP